MGRPRTNRPADSFTLTETSVAAGLSARGMEFLVRSGLAPDQAPSLTDPAAHLRDTNGLKHAALIGAFVQANIPLLAAARLAREVNLELRQRYYVLRSNLERFLDNKALNPAHPNWPFEDEVRKLFGCPLPSEEEAFWLHHLLVVAGTYQADKALRGDFCIEIADRQYVYITAIDALPAHSMFREEKSYLDPTWRILGWERGNDELEIQHISDEFKRGFDIRDSTEWHAAAAVEKEYLDAHQSAISLVRINISAAIRKAFDRLRDHRISTKSSVDYTATIRPAPGRYDGCDLKGFPLDPQHPWNRDLSPAKRKVRLAEIETYVNKREGRRASKERLESDEDDCRPKYSLDDSGIPYIPVGVGRRTAEMPIDVAIRDRRGNKGK